MRENFSELEGTEGNRAGGERDREGFKQKDEKGQVFSFPGEGPRELENPFAAWVAFVVFRFTILPFEF